MLRLLKLFLLLKPVQVVICSAIGALTLALSYHPSRGRYGAGIDPVIFTIGVVFIIMAWLIYRKWSAELGQRKDER